MKNLSLFLWGIFLQLGVSIQAAQSSDYTTFEDYAASANESIFKVYAGDYKLDLEKQEATFPKTFLEGFRFIRQMVEDIGGDLEEEPIPLSEERVKTLNAFYTLYTALEEGKSYDMHTLFSISDDGNIINRKQAGVILSHLDFLQPEHEEFEAILYPSREAIGVGQLNYWSGYGESVEKLERLSDDDLKKAFDKKRLNFIDSSLGIIAQERELVRKALQEIALDLNKESVAKGYRSIKSRLAHLAPAQVILADVLSVDDLKKNIIFVEGNEKILFLDDYGLVDFAGLQHMKDKDSIQVISVGRNNLKKLLNNELEGFTNLTKFMAHVNDIESIEEDAFKGVEKLQELWLYKNPLQSEGIADGAFSHLPELKTIRIDKSLKKDEKPLWSNSKLLEQEKNRWGLVSSCKIEFV